MGTRADFYIGRGQAAEWLGSIAYDGAPDSHVKDYRIVDATTEQEMRERVARLLTNDISATKPEQGWPWAWANSSVTDFAYAFDAGRVYASMFGSAWFNPSDYENADWEVPDDEGVKFPDMTEKSNFVENGPRSGFLLMYVPNKRKQK